MAENQTPQQQQNRGVRRLGAGAVPVAAAAGALGATLFLGTPGIRSVTAQDGRAMTLEQRSTAASLEGAFMRIAETVRAGLRSASRRGSVPTTLPAAAAATMTRPAATPARNRGAVVTGGAPQQDEGGAPNIESPFGDGFRFRFAVCLSPRAGARARTAVPA
jgi:hypothetical protein